MCVCICMHVHTHRIWWSIFVGDVYMISELTILHLLTNKGAHLFVYRYNHTKLSTFHISMSAEIAILPVLFMSPTFKRTVSQQTIWYSGFYNLPFWSSVVFSEPWIQELWCRCIHWGWALHDPLALHRFQLWFSVMFSIFCTVRFLWCQMVARLTRGYKNKA